MLVNLPLGYPFQLRTLKNCSILGFSLFSLKHKTCLLKEHGKYNKRCFLQDGYAEHVQTCTYSTDKMSSSYLFVFCVRLKTFQPPLVAPHPVGRVLKNIPVRRGLTFVCDTNSVGDTTFSKHTMCVTSE